MKKSVIILCLVALSLMIAGCGFLPSEPPIESNTADAEDTSSMPEPTAAPVNPDDVADSLIDQVVEEKKVYVPVETVIANETDETNETAEEKMQISGSLKLQNNQALCPHLVRNLDCDKYELARCEVKTLVGQNDFYPDVVSCRSGYDYKGENPNHKYCFIQECGPLYEENIVYAYGGTVAYAEYMYSVDKTSTGIMTHYTLDKCGEEHKEFKTSFDCKVYKSDLKNI